MRDVLKSIYPWVIFAGWVLIVAVLYWAQAILVPVALAVLLSFVLTPVVTPPSAVVRAPSGPAGW
jgi:predicted PurR-regulated permease PerM